MKRVNDIDYVTRTTETVTPFGNGYLYERRSRTVRSAEPRRERPAGTKPVRTTVPELLLTVLADVNAIRGSVRADPKHADDLCALLADRLENWISEN